MQFSALLACLALTLALAVGSASCDSAPSEATALEAPKLLHLAELMATKGSRRPSVEEVVGAYEQYVRLFRRQWELTAGKLGLAGDGLSQEKQYERISELLDDDRVETLPQTVFRAFDQTEPSEHLKVTKELRKRIEDAFE